MISLYFLAFIWMGAAYVAGSVNFSILVLTLTGRPDPRKAGSKNAGATNVYRQAGFFWAALVLLLDMGRALAVGLAAKSFVPASMAPWVGFFLIVGNRYPCFHGFAGGKGVANYLGFTLALAPVWALLSAPAWAVVLKKTRAPFLGSFAMVLVLSMGMIFPGKIGWAGFAGVCATVVLIAISHRSNIRNWLTSRR